MVGSGMMNGLMSLDGESKKIPLNLQYGDKLTLSQVEDFAKDSAYFQKGYEQSKSGIKNYNKIN